jgi:4-aminobutyrate aminotransferase-like enzyme
VIRILVPILAADEDVDEGLRILEESLVDAGAGTS